MKPYTKTIIDPDDLRKNWRGNRLSKHRKGITGGKGYFNIYIGNSNYHRKVKDRANKKRMRRIQKAINTE